VRGGDVGAGVQHARGHPARLHELVERRGLSDRVVAHRRQRAVATRAQRDGLARGSAVADRPEHLRAGQRELHRSFDVARGHRREDDVGPRRPLAAEATTEIARDDADVLGAQAQQPRDALAVAEDALGRVVQGQALGPLPDRHGAVWLHRIVGLGRRQVRLLDADLRLLQPGLGVAVPAVRLLVRTRRVLRREGLLAPPLEAHLRRLDGVVGAHELGALVGGLRRVGDDHRDRLVRIEHAVVLQELQLPGGGIAGHLPGRRQTRGVVV